MRGTLASGRWRGPRSGGASGCCRGVWRLRLPLPWPGVPHCNAWALAAGDGIVLVDCGMDEPGSMRHLERALEQVGLRLEHVRLLVCTHAHIDHCGQAAAIQARTGCPLWIHPRHEHLTARADDPDAALARRIEIARQSGVPEEPLQAWAERRRGEGDGMSGPLDARARPAAGRRRRDRSRRLAGARDARPRAVARRPAPARAPAAAVRRPRARAHLAVLRPRLDAGSRRRVPRVARARRRARRAAEPVRPRAPVHRPARPRRGLPGAGAPSASTRSSPRWPSAARRPPSTCCRRSTARS